MTEDEADEQERAEAEALARALEGTPERTVAGKAPVESLETAALLRAVAAPAELSDQRAKALLTALGPEIERHVSPERSRRRAVTWFAAASLAAAAAVALYVSGGLVGGPAVDSPARRPIVAQVGGLPVPRRELLAAQAALGADSDRKAASAVFEREMRAYRRSVLRTIKGAYPTAVGMLEPARAR